MATKSADHVANDPVLVTLFSMQAFLPFLCMSLFVNTQLVSDSFLVTGAASASS